MLTGDGRFPRLFKSLTKTQILILNDWGPDRLNSSQRPVDTWHDVIGEPTFADAILDRLVHNVYRVDLDGQSMRKNKIKTGDENRQN